MEDDQKITLGTNYKIKFRFGADRGDTDSWRGDPHAAAGGQLSKGEGQRGDIDLLEHRYWAAAGGFAVRSKQME